MLTSVDLALLAAYPGEYQQALIKKLYFGFEAGAVGISTMPGLKSAMNLHKIVTKDGLKPYTGDFVPTKDSIGFVPRKLEVKKAQLDLTIEPSKFIGTFMERNRGKGENPNNETIPFEQVVFEAVNDQVRDELVRETIYNGVGADAFTTYAAGSAYPGGSLVKFTQGGEVRYFRCISAATTGQSPDTNPEKWAYAGARAIAKGFKKILQDEVTGGGIKPAQVISTGLITNANAYAQFTAVWRGLPEVVREKGATIFCSTNSVDALNDDYESKVSKNFETINGVKTLAKTDGKCRVQSVNWLSGTHKLLATPGGNLWMGTDQTSDLNTLKALARMYAIDYGMSFMIGFNLADLDVISMNDQF